ncbi:hypothetical protein B6U98_02620 [Thermoplasmatales archaeon ex4572_165]|nr:MAG: hypothetical protein B6U98_02620 [Thermoplasmatales archaeon ex4572_165]RLF60167.1 MAG: hypothetical protein DRN27_00375 [Thermoplasmata archaeon]
MMSFHEMKDKDYIPQKTQLMMMIGGGFGLAKTLLLNLSDLKKLRIIPPNSERYIRPTRPYDLPSFESSMKLCVSEEKYLRPTLHCDHHEPEVIALAHQLGAYKKTDKEFAEDAFHFVKENMTLEIIAFNPVSETIKRGTGTCIHLISVFIALCRAAGIKARYKMFAMNMIKAWYDAVVDVDPLVKKWYDSMGYFMIEGEGEIYIDGEWIVAHVGPKAERQAAAGIPITKFGEDSLGRWFFAIPGSIMVMESIPFGLAGAIRGLSKIAPGSMERVNISIQKQIASGKKIIADAGGVEAYDKNAREKMEIKQPTLQLQTKDEIVFS